MTLDYSSPMELNPPASGHRLFKLITPLLLFFGVQLWLVLFHGFYGWTFQHKAVLIALIVSLIPPIQTLVGRLFNRIREILPRTRRIFAAVIALIGTLYFPETGWLQHRNFLPKWQDELSYRIQFQQLAHGRLWYPQHPCADFFDTFQVLVRPVYASIYFPGPSVLYTPTLLAHLPLWAMSSLIAGLAVGALFLVVSELIDPLAGLLASLMLLANSMYRKLALMVFGYPLIVLLTIGAAFCWLHWRKQPSVKRAIPIGVLLGWAAITRPLDAIILALPIAIDYAISFRRRMIGENIRQASAVIAGALPFIILQIIFNVGVTGHVTLTPFELYAQRDYPDTTFGFHTFDSTHRPVSVIAQKQAFHDQWTAPAIQHHTPGNVLRGWFPTGIKDVLDNLLPDRWLIILVPAGLTGLFTRPRLLFWLTLPLYMVFYSFYAFSLPQYAMIAGPAVILIVLLGVERITNTWLRTAGFFQIFLVSALVILSLTEMAEFNPYIRDEAFDPPGLGNIDQQLATLPHKPAVVLFHFPPNGNPHEEPVYNIDVAWPDDAAVVRAHDLGPRNIEIFNYYARRQPDRAFYRYDRADDSIAFLGFARELGKGN